MSSREFVLGLTAMAVVVNGCAGQPRPARDAAQAEAAFAGGLEGRAEAQPPDPSPAGPAAATSASPSSPTPGPASAATPAPGVGAPNAPDGQAAPAALPVAAVPPHSEEGSESDREKRDPHSMRRYVGWITLSVGVEAAIVAVATSIMIEYQKGIRDNHCDAQKVCDGRGKASTDTIDSIVPWNTASWITAAAGIGAGLTLVLVSQPRGQDDHEAAITVSPMPSGAGINLRGAF